MSSFDATGIINKMNRCYVITWKEAAKLELFWIFMSNFCKIVFDKIVLCYKLKGKNEMLFSIRFTISHFCKISFSSLAKFI